MKLRITVHGVAYEVDVEVLDPGDGFPNGSSLPAARAAAPAPAAAAPPVRLPASPGPAPGGAGVVASPIAGTILEVRGRAGETVAKGQILLVLEAMKMKTSIAAPAPGKIRRVAVAAGDPVREGQTLVELE